MKVGIAGVTGKFARRLLTHLLESSTRNGHESLTVKGYCRDPAKPPSSLSSSPNLELFQGSAFDHEALASFVQGCDVVVCCYLGALIDACDAATPPVPRYVSSDWALDYTKLKLGELFPKDPMIHVKAYLESKRNVTGVHILVGGFMEPIFSSFFGTVDADSNFIRYWGDGSEIMEGTTYDDAARFTARVVLDRQASGVLRFVGGRATIKEIARSYEKVYGVPVTLERRGSLDDLYKMMHDLREKNAQDVYCYMSLYAISALPNLISNGSQAATFNTEQSLTAFYYYWVNGQTFVGPELDNARYPDVKPADWETYMSSWPREQIGSLTLL